MEVYIIVGMAVLIYTFVTLLLNSECWNPEHQKCQCEECKSLCSATRALTPSVIQAGMDPLARLMEGAPLPGVLGATRDARPRGALVHASLAAAPAIGDKKGRHLTGTFCLTGDTMEGIIQCLVFLKAFSLSAWKRRRAARSECAHRGCPQTPELPFKSSKVFYQSQGQGRAVGGNTSFRKQRVPLGWAALVARRVARE
ncbi:hypothetical protein B5X24_HaOG214842 [Helicoverpa armigera]|nr:hypothetical protein B5X24_HaOG214842 [Helicoverpa armigera]